MKHLNIPIPDDVHKELRSVAVEYDKTVSVMVRDLVVALLNERRRDIGQPEMYATGRQVPGRSGTEDGGGQSGEGSERRVDIGDAGRGHYDGKDGGWEGPGAQDQQKARRGEVEGLPKVLPRK